MEGRIIGGSQLARENSEALAFDLSFADGDGKLGNKRRNDKNRDAYLDIAKLLKKLGIE